jgi:hypothetical protein
MNYKKIYNSICDSAKKQNRRKLKIKDDSYVYYEAHHILPVCLGGEGKKHQLNHPNIVLLTAREHYLCHKLLCEIYKGHKDIIYSFWAMNNQNSKKQFRYKPSARNYEYARKLFSESIMGDKNPSKAIIGKYKRSEETRNQMKISAKKAWSSENQPVHVCPHCGKVGKSNIMFRHHFENCPTYTGNARTWSENQKQNYKKENHCFFGKKRPEHSLFMSVNNPNKVKI